MYSLKTYSNSLLYHFFRTKQKLALTDDQGEYILNGYNVITQYPRTFPYGGITFEYTGTNKTEERVSTSFARRLKRDLIVEVHTPYHLNYQFFFFFGFGNI